MSFFCVRGFAKPNEVADLAASGKPSVAGEEQGSQYLTGLAGSDAVRSVVTRPEVARLARDILKVQGPLAYLSLTALTVEPGSQGMRGHIDYPHFHPSCPNDKPMVAQFVLALDGTTGGRAPTWLEHSSQIFELEPGDLLAFAGNTLHGVLPNASDRPRTNLLWSVGPAWVRPMQLSLWGFPKIDDVSYRDLIEESRKR